MNEQSLDKCEPDDSTYDTFEKVGYQEAVKPFGKQRKPNKGEVQLKWLVKYGGINCYKEKVDISQFKLPIDAVMGMVRHAQRGQGSYHHAESKVIGAAYLDNKGHCIPKRDWDDKDKIDRQLNSLGWEYSCFELSSHHGRADVGCEHCNTYIECGGVIPEKCLSSLGINVITSEGKFVFMHSDPPPSKERLEVDRSLMRTSTRRFIVLDSQNIDEKERYDIYVYEEGDKLDEL